MLFCDYLYLKEENLLILFVIQVTIVRLDKLAHLILLVIQVTIIRLDKLAHSPYNLKPTASI